MDKDEFIWRLNNILPGEKVKESKLDPPETSIYFSNKTLCLFAKVFVSARNFSTLFLNLFKLKSIKKIIYILLPKSYKYLQNLYVLNYRKI